MGFRAQKMTKPQLIQACNFLKDTGNISDHLMTTVCMQADKMSPKDTMTVAIWNSVTPQEEENGIYNANFEECYTGTEATCPQGSTFTRNTVDDKGNQQYCCDSEPVEVTAQVVLNASGTPSQKQFDEIIDSSTISTSEKQKEKLRYEQEMATLMTMLKDMEKQGKMRNNEAYEMLVALQKVKTEFSEQINKLTDNITEYFGGATESENIRVMQEKIREKGVVTRVFDVIWKNVAWLARAAGGLFARGATTLARHYVYMLVYHPATLRFFIYTAMELKSEFCARFGMIHRVPKQSVWEKLRAMPASTLQKLSDGKAWMMASVQVILEETMAFKQLESIIAYIMDPVFNLAVLPVIGIVFGASGAATAVIYGMLQFGGKIAGKAFGRMLETEMWKNNALASLAETKIWFFDWSQCKQIVETEDEIPTRCPNAPWSMCYKSEIAQYKMQTGTQANDRGVNYAARAPNNPFQRKRALSAESDSDGGGSDNDNYLTPPGKRPRYQAPVINVAMPFKQFEPPTANMDFGNSDDDEL
jgi:predicted CopG family antitoxin